MHIWMTRPREDSAPAAAMLRAMGHEVHCAPLMTIDFDAPRRLDLSNMQAFLATSANGVRALIHQRSDAPALGLPVLCVGDATCRAAHDAGFERVSSAGGDVASLAALVCDTLSPQQGRLVHITGQARAGDLAGLLAPAGFTVTIEQLYRAAPVARLDAETLMLVKSGAIDAVMLYSPRTAHLYVDQIASLGLADHVRGIGHFCLSRAVAEALAPLGIDPARRHVAPEPTQAALFALLPEGDK